MWSVASWPPLSLHRHPVDQTLGDDEEINFCDQPVDDSCQCHHDRLISSLSTNTKTPVGQTLGDDEQIS